METLLNTLMQQLIQSNDFTIKEKWNELYSIYTAPLNVSSKMQEVNNLLDHFKSENNDYQLQQPLRMPDYRIQTQYRKKSESSNEFTQSTDRIVSQGNQNQNFGNQMNEQRSKIYNSGLLKVEIKQLIKQMESGTLEIEKMIND